MMTRSGLHDSLSDDSMLLEGVAEMLTRSQTTLRACIMVDAKLDLVWLDTSVIHQLFDNISMLFREVKSRGLLPNQAFDWDHAGYGLESGVTRIPGRRHGLECHLDIGTHSFHCLCANHERSKNNHPQQNVER